MVISKNLYDLGYQTGGVKIYDLDRSEYNWDLEVPIINVDAYDHDHGEAYFPITCIRWYTDTQVLFSTGEGYVKLYNIVDPDPSKRLRHQYYHKMSGINWLDIDSNKYSFVTGGQDHWLRVYDFTTMKESIGN